MFKEKPGDDTGMQTRVWGPAGWLFLHSIAQNYPWKPTVEQQKNYLNFFTLIGNVLPCRYCRESYQEFIKEPDTKLDISKLKNRTSLVTWLYDIHNKVNKKLGIKCKESLKQVWDKYESFRSKCTKSPEIVEKIKKGCLDPMKGYRKKCLIEIIKVDKDGNAFGKRKLHRSFRRDKNITFGKRKLRKNSLIKLISIKKSNQKGKKLMAKFDIGGRSRVIHFGASGMSDYTRHRDKIRRNRYIFRHFKDLKTNDPTRAGYLSMFVLWNKPSLQASITDYRRRLNTYNKTGKFPTKIPGYSSPGKRKGN